MPTLLILRFSGTLCVAGGAGLVSLFFSQGGCLGDGCNSGTLPGTTENETLLGLATVSSLLTGGVGLFLAASRRMPIRKSGLATVICVAGGALFATAAAITGAKTGGETWLMPLFVFPALWLLTAAWIVVGVIVLQTELVPRRLAITLIVTASLLPLYQQQSPGNFLPGLLGLAWAAVGMHLVVRGRQTAIRVNEPRSNTVG